MNDSNSILKLEDISRRYIVGDTVVHALKGISLSFAQPEFVIIIGPSGSGKSTLLNISGGLEKPSEGKVFVKGQDLLSLSDSELTNIRRYEVGFVFQFFNLHPMLTALENVELPMLITGQKRKKRVKKAMELLSLVNLEERATHLPHELSGGEKQRVGIARALANDPGVILADEPTGDLDRVTGEGITQLLYSLTDKMNKLVIVVSHDENLMNKATRLLTMEDGMIIHDSSLQ